MGKIPVVAGIGELLWDVFPDGKQVGGAPFNFAYHAAQAGCKAYVVSAVGKDEAGEELRSLAPDMALNGDYIQENAYPTGRVSVELDAGGSPAYTIHEQVAWDFLTWDVRLESLAKKLDAVSFGSLAQRCETSARTIQKFLSCLSPSCIKVFDVNLRQHFFSEDLIKASLAQTDLLKLNEEELPVIAGFHKLKGCQQDQLRMLQSLYGITYAVLTMGSKGSILLGQGQCAAIKAPVVRVADSVGAGDAFSAVLVAGMLNKLSLKKAQQAATEAAAFVCTQKGATPAMPEKLFHHFKHPNN